MYYDENTIAYLNGEWQKAKDSSTGLYSQSMHYGNGVFEGIRSYQCSNGAKVLKAKEHFDRLIYSASKVHIQVNQSSEELIDICYQLLEKNNLQNAYIRPLIFANENMGLVPETKANIFMCAWDWDKYFDKSVSMMTSSYTRPGPKSCHVDAKVTGHYANSLISLQEAKSKGFDDALLLDGQGKVAEATGANFFFQKNNTLYTAPKGNILPGITRSIVMEICQELGIKVEEKHFTQNEVHQSDAAFLCGTAIEINEVESLDSQNFKLSWNESFGSEIQKRFEQYVRT